MSQFSEVTKVGIVFPLVGISEQARQITLSIPQFY